MQAHSHSLPAGAAVSKPGEVGALTLRLYLPELFSVRVSVGGRCSVSLLDKLVGSVHVSTDRGAIKAHKLR